MCEHHSHGNGITAMSVSAIGGQPNMSSGYAATMLGESNKTIPSLHSSLTGMPKTYEDFVHSFGGQDFQSSYASASKEKKYTALVNNMMTSYRAKIQGAYGTQNDALGDRLIQERAEQIVALHNAIFG